MLRKICDNKTNTKKNMFTCIKCDYECNTMFLYKQHCETKKHKKNECSKMLTKICELKCACGKVYKHVQSFNRHKKQCSKVDDNENKELRGMISALISQNKDILTENKEMRHIVKDMLPKMGNTTVNKFNLNVFLNEKCKDALNLTEFIETLQLKMIDLDDTRQYGYVTGITNIMIRGLRELEHHRRPIHCSDLKREILYVKDNNSWAKDNEDKALMKRAISCVAKRQIDTIKDWENANGTWNNTERGKQMYVDIVKNVTGSEGNISDNKIIKTIAKEVTIEKI